MLYFFLSFILVTPGLIGWGLLVARLTNELEGAYYLPEYGWIGLLVAGFCGITLNFIMPLSWYVTVPFLVVGTISLIIYRSDARRPNPSVDPQWLITAAAVMLGTIFIIIAARRPPSYDTGLYHLQSVLWMHQSIIPLGLANLHGRFGFNSVWFPISAMHWLPFLGLASAFTVNPAISFLFVWALLIRITQNSKSGVLTRIFCLVLFLLITCFTAGRELIVSELSGLETDWPAVTATLYSLILALDLIDKAHDRSYRVAQGFLLTVTSFLAVTIKLSQIPVLLVPIVMLPLFVRENFWKVRKAYWILPTIFGLVWIARGVATSGCLAYPQSSSCLMNLPWSISAVQVHHEALAIRSWSRLPGVESEALLSRWSWAREWLENLPKNQTARLLGFVMIAAFSIYLFEICLARLNWNPGRRRSRSPTLCRYHFYLMTVYILGIAFWFYEAPDVRYGTGFLVAVPVYCLSLAVRHIFENSKVWQYAGLGCFAGALLFFRSNFIAAGIHQRDLTDRAPLFPPVKMIVQKNWQGREIHVPEQGDQCWKIDLPCTPYPNRSITFSKLLFYPEFIREQAE